VCSLALTHVPDLIAAPRLIPAGPPVAGSVKGWTSIAATCAASMAIVAAAVVTAQLAGPVIAGAIAAFPTMSTALAAAIATRRDAPAAASALLGLVRSLPCYLTFCLLFALLEPSFGLTALALA
jgi:hypothetical protein